MTALLSHTNAIPDASLSMLSGTATDLGNLKLLQVPSPYATISGTSFDIAGTFSARTVRVAAIIATNLQSSAEITIDLLNDGTVLTDGEAFTVTDGVFTTSGGEVYSVRALEAAGGRTTILLTLPSDVTTDEMRVTVTGAASTTRIGALWCAPAFEHGIDAGWRTVPTDYSRINQVEATPWVSRGARPRSIAATMSLIPEHKAIGAGGLEQLFQRLGRSAPVLFLPRSDPQYQHLAVYGLLQSEGQVSHVRGRNYRAEFDVLAIGG